MRLHPKSRQGSAASSSVEFAAIGLVFMLLTLSIVEIAWQLTIDMALNFGAQEASRFGITGATAPAGMTPVPTSRGAAIQALVLARSGGILSAANLTLSETSYSSLANYGSSGAATPGAGTGGQVVTYSLTYAQPFFTPLARLIVGSTSLTHRATAVVQNEPF